MEGQLKEQSAKLVGFFFIKSFRMWNLMRSHKKVWASEKSDNLQSYIQKVAGEDEVDAQIIMCLLQKGVGGLLPSAIAAELAECSLKRLLAGYST